MRKLIVALLLILGPLPASAQFIGKGPQKAVTASGCTAATNFLARTSLTGADATRYTNLICSLVTHSIITGNLSGANGCGSKVDAMGILAAPNSTTALLNICGTANSPFTVTNAPTFTANSGYVASGVASFIDTGFNPTTGTPNYSQNSAHMSVWVVSGSGTNANATFGNQVTGGNGDTHLFARFTDTHFYSRINAQSGSAGSGFAVSDPPVGLLVGSRAASTGVVLYFNGTSLGTTTETSFTPVNGTFTVLKVNGGASDQTHTIGFFSVGGNLSSTEQANLCHDVNVFMTSANGAASVC